MIVAKCAPRVVAVSISTGGIPKIPQTQGQLCPTGFAGDGRAHAKHAVPERAVSVFDIEILHQLVDEGFAISPGVMGENLTVAGLDVQQLAPGTLLAIGDQAVLRLEAPRKPCYVLDAIDPRLKEVVVGRCGFMASVVHGGIVAPGMAIHVLRNVSDESTLEADLPPVAGSDVIVGASAGIAGQREERQIAGQW